MRLPCVPCPAAVWITLALIAVSAACGAVTDLSFNMAGYLWQIVNCAFTAGYSLSLRGAMDRVSCPTATLTRTRTPRLWPGTCWADDAWRGRGREVAAC